MVVPRDLTQIKNYIGKAIRVTLQYRDGIVVGNLAFFNFEQQVIHMSDYTRLIPSKEEGEPGVQTNGDFMVINMKEWKFLEVEENK